MSLIVRVAFFLLLGVTLGSGIASVWHFVPLTTSKRVEEALRQDRASDLLATLPLTAGAADAELALLGAEARAVLVLDHGASTSHLDVAQALVETAEAAWATDLGLIARALVAVAREQPHLEEALFEEITKRVDERANARLLTTYGRLLDRRGESTAALRALLSSSTLGRPSGRTLALAAAAQLRLARTEEAARTVRRCLDSFANNGRCGAIAYLLALADPEAMQPTTAMSLAERFSTSDIVDAAPLRIAASVVARSQADQEAAAEQKAPIDYGALRGFPRLLATTTGIALTDGDVDAARAIINNVSLAERTTSRVLAARTLQVGILDKLIDDGWVTLEKMERPREGLHFPLAAGHVEADWRRPPVYLRADVDGRLVPLSNVVLDGLSAGDLDVATAAKTWAPIVVATYAIAAGKYKVAEALLDDAKAAGSAPLDEALLRLRIAARRGKLMSKRRARPLLKAASERPDLVVELVADALASSQIGLATRGLSALHKADIAGPRVSALAALHALYTGGARAEVDEFVDFFGDCKPADQACRGQRLRAHGRQVTTTRMQVAAIDGDIVRAQKLADTLVAELVDVEAVRRFAPSFDAIAHVMLADALGRKGSRPAAMDWLKELAVDARTAGQALTFLAEHAAAAGDRKNAAQYRRLAKDKPPFVIEPTVFKKETKAVQKAKPNPNVGANGAKKSAADRPMSMHPYKGSVGDDPTFRGDRAFGRRNGLAFGHAVHGRPDEHRARADQRR